ncbi:arginine deiminase family protein [Silanimonas sp.]|jgi:N-dimethylarginine dimethylaminohydrolase|uniref:dimethylarginine dimethylaminohydrolase family protein n=1 Tax=Silanimonas sp. TaxID=1929290 RepID=UPI0022C1A085|nr:arginine deiminase family protein [Silanimonas sp.]MCZ8116327.1 arginine deiminase family protein [Silanimonas sp.]
MTLRIRQRGGGTPRATNWGLDSEYGRLTDVLVGPVDHFSWQAGNAVAQRSVRVGRDFDAQVARRQHQEMVQAFEEAGTRVHRLEPDANLPYQVFARDSSVMTPWGAVITQPRKPYRRGEYAACLEFYLRQGIPIYDLVTAGHLEGGDFMVLQPGVAVCGYSGERSSEAAVRQVEEWFRSEGWDFYGYPFDSHFLHLDVQFGMLAPGLAVACTEALEPAFLEWVAAQGIRVIPVTYGDAMDLGCNVVALGNGRVMVPASSRSLIAACRAEGLTVYAPDVSMISAGGGAVHCMCQALRRDSVA